MTCLIPKGAGAATASHEKEYCQCDMDAARARIKKLESVKIEEAKELFAGYTKKIQKLETALKSAEKIIEPMGDPRLMQPSPECVEWLKCNERLLRGIE